MTVKAVETDAGKGDEKRESAEEDATALEIERRGPNRRARPAPVVATSMVVPVGKEDEGEDQKDGGKEEDRRRDANKEDPPAPVVGRRAASRCARPESAAESATAEVVEEQRKKDGSPAPRARRGAVESSEPIRTDDCEEEAPALGVGRRGASRRAQPAPALAEPASKVAEEQKAPRIPCSRHVKAKSTEPMKLNDEEDKKAATMPEEEDVPAVGVGRRGASRRVRRAPAVVAAEEEPRAPEVIRLDDSEDEEKEDKKLHEKDDEVPAIGVGQLGAPAPVEARATRRRAATSKAEALDVTEEAVHTRATRQRKPTMKAAAAAAVEKALPKATRRKVVKKTSSQQDEQEKPQEAVSAPVSDVGRDNPEEPEEASGPQNREQKQKHEVVVILEDEILVQKTPAQDLLVTDKDSMDHSALQGQEVGVEKCPVRLASQDDSPIMGLVSITTEQAADKNEGANFQDGEESSGSLDNKRVFEEILDAGEKKEMVPIIQGLQVLLTEEHAEEIVTDDANRKSEIGSFNEVPHGTEETVEANTEEDLVSQNKEDINTDELQDDLADESVLVDCSGNIKLFAEEETHEVNTEDGVSLQEKGDVPVDMALFDIVAETSEANTEDEVSQNKEDIIIDELRADLEYGSVLVEEETNEIDTKDGVSFQKGEVPVDMAVPDISSSDISCVKMEKSGDITALDEDGEGKNSYAGICHPDKPSEVVIGDSVSLVTATDSKVVQEDVEEDQFQTIFIHGDQVAAADTLPEVKMIDCEVEEKKATIIDEQQQSMVTMDDNVDENHFETDVVHADEQKEVVNNDEVPEFTGTEGVLEEEKAAIITVEVTMDDDVDENDFETDVVHADEQKEVVSIDEVPEFTWTKGVLEEDKAAMITEEVPQSTGKMDKGDEKNQFKNAFVNADQVLTADSVPDLEITDCEPIEDKATLIIDQKQQITDTMDKDCADDHDENDADHVIEKRKVANANEVSELTGTNDEVAEEGEAVVIAEAVPQSTGTDEDVEEGQFQTFFVHAEQVGTSDGVSDLKITDCEEKTTLIIDVKQQSTDSMDEAVVFSCSETEELKEVATDDKMLYLTGTEGEVLEKDKAALTTEEVLHGTGTMDDCVQKHYFEIGFVQDDELNNAVTIDNVPEITEIDGAAKNTVVCDLPPEPNVAKEFNDHITQAFLDNVTESLCKSIITVEPTASVSDGIIVCNNSSEKNTTELEGIQEEKVVKVAKKSVDLTKLSLRQLRTKIKEKLNSKKNKDAKRVALARVDGNVCRSHSKGQQQNLNLQQH